MAEPNTVESSAVNLRETIRTVQWPSDIQGVLEKIAFRVHLDYVKKEIERPSDANQDEAKNIFYNWARKIPLIEPLDTVPLYLNAVLNDYASRHKYCAGTDFDRWITAQNQLADSIYGYCS